MRGPPFWSVTVAIRWAYEILEAPVGAQGYLSGSSGHTLMSRADWIAQAGRVRAAVGQLGRQEQAVARFFLGRCGTDADAQVVRGLCIAAMSDRHREILDRADHKALDMLIVRYSNRKMPWRPILSAMGCRFEDAKEAVICIAEAMHAVNVRIEAGVRPDLEAAGVLTPRETYAEDE